MLHAINHRKARFAAFRSAVTHVRLEDVVTSTVFGPIAFMAPDCRDRAIALTGEALAVPIPAASGELRADFWPRFALAEEGLRARYSEPDLVLADERGPLVVIEVKWGAPLGKHELASQWASLPATARRRATHVLLVQEPQLYRNDIDGDLALIERRGLGPWAPLLRSWCSLAALPMLAAGPGTSDSVRRWAAAVGELLRREHRVAMHGWETLGLRAPGKSGWHFRQLWLANARSVERHVGGGTMIEQDSLWLSFANASHAGHEVDALVQALRELLADGGLGAHRVHLETEEGENHETDQDWAVGYCLYTFKLVPARGRATNRGMIALGVSFWRAEDERGTGWSGAGSAKLYVGFSPPKAMGWTPSSLVVDGTGQSLDTVPLPPRRWRGTGPGGMSEAWFLCLRLPALRSRVDLEREVARPLRLLLDGRGDNLAFAASTALLPPPNSEA